MRDMDSKATRSDQARTTCSNCVDHSCGLLYADCACCAAWAAGPGDVTLGAAALLMPRTAADAASADAVVAGAGR